MAARILQVSSAVVLVHVRVSPEGELDLFSGLNDAHNKRQDLTSCCDRVVQLLGDHSLVLLQQLSQSRWQ